MFHILWRRRVFPLGGAALFGVLALLYILFATKVYTISARITVQPVRFKPLPELTDNSSMSASENYINTQAELITATPTLALALQMPGVDELSLWDDVENRILHLKRKLKVEVGKKNEIITITFDSPNPPEGSILVKSVVSAYIDYQAGQMRNSTTGVLNILRKEMHDLNRDLEEKTKQLAQFRRENDTLSLGEDKNNIVMERLSKLSDALTAADVEVLNAKSTYETAAGSFKADPKKAERLKNFGDTGGMVTVDEASLRSEMFALQQRLRDVQRQYLPNHPVVVAARNRLDQMELAYMTLMQQKLVAARQKRDDLQASVNQLRQQVLNQSDKAQQYVKLASDVRRLEELSRQLDDRIKTTNLTENAGALNITVVDEAGLDDNMPARPRKAQTLAISLILGLGLGVLGAFVREFTDRSLKSADEIEKSLGIPVLGAVPVMPRQYGPETHARAVHLNPGSDSADAYRSLRAAVSLNAGPRKFKTIMVTSPLEGDGKTTVACNLAIALAKEGARVLLVDTNLRDPSIHQIFGLPNDRGLTSLLTSDTSGGQAIQHSGLGQLDILPAGPTQENPSVLLNSPTLTETMVQIARLYEMVIVDAAAIIPVVDGRIVAASCDATILVLNGKKSDIKLSSQACDGLLSVGAEVLGVVVNAVSVDRMTDGFDVSYAHLGGYVGEQGFGKYMSDRVDEARSRP